MDIAYVTRSQFLADCESAIRSQRAALDAGGTVQVTFAADAPGYAGRALVTIRAGNTSFFGSDWTSADTTSFPVRIRAAATALHTCGCIGLYRVVHADGVLTITRV